MRRHTRIGRPRGGTQPRHPAPQRGIALMECLVSILVFSFGVLGLIGLEARAINFSVDSEDRNRASLFANDVASSMWLAGTVTVPAATLTAWQVSVAAPAGVGLPNGVIAITPVAGITNAADISITWRSPSKAVTDSDTFITRVTLP